MGDIEAPGGYFVGRPANYAEKPKDSDQPANTQGTPGDYFVGRPQHQQQGVETTPAAATTSAEQKKPGFFAKLFPCIAPSTAES